MAKGKHAAALFEVIHSDKRFNRKESGGALRTPKWWFKGQGKSAGAGNDNNISADSTPAGLQPAGFSSSPAGLPHRPALAAEFISGEGGGTKILPYMNMTLDSDRQEIAFKISYTSAIVTIFAVLVVIGLAYVIGRHMSRGPAMVLGSPPTEQIKAGPVQANVLDVRNKPAADAVETQTNSTAASSASVSEKKPTFNEPRPPKTLMEQDSNRAKGLNYVIVQSYPDEKDAAAARDILIQNQILCTIEKGLPYAPQWYCVVGITGFDKISNSSEYDGYVKSIQAVSRKFAGTSKFKEFKPQAYKWR